MKHEDAWVLMGVMIFMASTSLVLYFTEASTTGQAYGAPSQIQTLAKAPFTDLPYNGKPIEMPFAGRCYRDEGSQVVYQQVATQDVGRLFDGCYQAVDGNYYYYKYYCVGDSKISQVWLRITPGCNKQQ